MVVPIYDDNPFAEPVKPVVTWCLIAANLAIFFYEAGASQLALDRMIDTFSLTPAALMGDMSARGWVPAFATLVTYQFFHADIAHLVGNRGLEEEGPDVSPGTVLHRVGDVDVHAGGGEAVAGDRLDPQRDRLGGDRVDRGLDGLDRHTRADQRAEQHVAAGAGRRVDPQGGHRAALATRAANTPAP